MQGYDHSQIVPPGFWLRLLVIGKNQVKIVGLFHSFRNFKILIAT